MPLNVSRFVLITLALSLFFAGRAPAHPSSVDPVRQAVEGFELAVEARSVDAVSKRMAPDVVVIENGERNDGWEDFRDHHLVPEFKEAGLSWKRELLKSKTEATMGWAYSRATARATRPRGEVEYTLYSTYILEKRGGAWLIVSLNWSIHSAVVSPTAK